MCTAGADPSSPPPLPAPPPRPQQQLSWLVTEISTLDLGASLTASQSTLSLPSAAGSEVTIAPPDPDPTPDCRPWSDPVEANKVQTPSAPESTPSTPASAGVGLTPARGSVFPLANPLGVCPSDEGYDGELMGQSGPALTSSAVPVPCCMVAGLADSALTLGDVLGGGLGGKAAANALGFGGKVAAKVM